MKAVILNTDSILNPGDAGIVLAQIRLLRKIFPGLILSLTSRTPDLDRRHYASLGVSCLSPLIPAPSLWRGAGRKIVRSLIGLFDVPSQARLLNELRTSDFVLSTGGGPFYSNRLTAPGPTFYQNVLHVRLAQALGKPVFFLPQSFGPFGSSAARRSVLRLLDSPRTAAIFVREVESRDVFDSRVPKRVRDKLVLCPDMALWLEPEQPGKEDPALAAVPRPRLVLTVRDWDFPEAGSRAEREALKIRYLLAVRDAAFRFIGRKGGTAVVVPHTRGPGDFEDDRLLSGRLWALLKAGLPEKRRLYLEPPADAPPARFLDLYASADVVLATRTHSAVFALLSGTAVVSIDYQPKGRGIMGMLGLGDWSFPIDRLETEPLAEAVEAVFDRRFETRLRLAARLASLRKEIEAKIRAALKDFT
ncbi:MAG: polysaccharide pyruvyl transferase family protein [Candidatus Aminicenantes bacterium]|nr:polysaccharide pyruvyl transferase family protein [Candidatus Aminicenantes bacterium]